MKQAKSSADAKAGAPDSVDSVLAWIHSFDRFDGRKGIKPGLERMEYVLELLGNPHDDMKFLHVAGTNGKGSTCAYLASILKEAGYRVGLFTSPYLASFHDRMSVGGMNITDDELIAMAGLLRTAVEAVSSTVHGRPTEFEVVTLLSILHYSRAGVDVVVWETGLGGRLDSTNVVTPVLSLITNVGFDHQAILGDTLAQIAAEKAGIIKPGVPVLTTATGEALQVILRTATEKSAPSHAWGRDFSADGRESLGLEGQQFAWRGMGEVLSELRIGMLGPHQIFNASLAIAAVVALQGMGWNLSEQALRRGLARTQWAGRFEVIERDPLLILDGAHNPEGAAVLAQTLDELVPDARLTVVIGILADKAIPEVLAPLLDRAAHVLITRAEIPRAANPQDVAEIARSIAPQLPLEVFESVGPALERARELTQSGVTDAILCTGTLYMISEARALLV